MCKPEAVSVSKAAVLIQRRIPCLSEMVNGVGWTVSAKMIVGHVSI